MEALQKSRLCDGLMEMVALVEKLAMMIRMLTDRQDADGSVLMMASPCGGVAPPSHHTSTRMKGHVNMVVGVAL